MEFDELVEHLDDLAQLADSEGFAALAGHLLNVRAIALDRRDVFAERVTGTPFSPTRRAARRTFMFNMLRGGRPSSSND